MHWFRKKSRTKRQRRMLSSGTTLQRSEAGQSLVEFALVLPVLLLLLLGIIQFGAVFNALITLNAAAREGARTAVMADNGKETAKETVLTLCQTAAFLTCEEDDITITTKDDDIEVTVSGKVPVFLFIFDKPEFTLQAQTTMRLEVIPE